MHKTAARENWFVKRESKDVKFALTPSDREALLYALQRMVVLIRFYNIPDEHREELIQLAKSYNFYINNLQQDGSIVFRNIQEHYDPIDDSDWEW